MWAILEGQQTKIDAAQKANKRQTGLNSFVDCARRWRLRQIALELIFRTACMAKRQIADKATSSLSVSMLVLQA